ncbi:hypothetical protein PTSG_07740 [Salpingoeca rosetta]|uniref:Glycoside hydrolase family 5 domain-containing protein n=1 Tax=Salpingoeca rosetta (strain ATCC 50818 / BSB-021) TaxID=946362 RepID=F2UHM8_SALR5|nr:uncharacterized protein PTSG_07740 [Salpingoeca rosetta]EGD76627.1 hypothetical protein PTSG_07740 [Salpingoeca rosetta]|eukprot:XP_004991541.1 hypothetical protein PTSG_07740 [Salpingoeca rosetta]
MLCCLWLVVLVFVSSNGAHAFTANIIAGSSSSGSSSSSNNKFGIGLVSEGNSRQLDLAHQLAGSGGWVLLTLAGIDLSTTGPQPSWVNSIKTLQGLNMNVVLRLSPPWGQSHYRDMSDDANHHNYTSLAAAFVRVVSQLPRSSNAPLWLQIENEPDLCYEWYCGQAGQPLSYTEIASEFAAFYLYVAAAVKAIGDPNLKVGPAPLAPGGALKCGCCGSQSCSGDSPGITGLQFMDAMTAAYPKVWSYADFLATHSYPASGIGYSFNVPFSQAGPGLTYYRLELNHTRPDLPVLITETGWASHTQGLPPCSEDNKAAWTVTAYQQLWLADDRILGVMPFMLQDATWGDKDGYAYVLTNGQQQPVFTQVQALRCQLQIDPSSCP